MDCSPFAFSVLRVQQDTTGAPSTFEFCYVNAAFAGLSGILPEEVIGRSFSANSKAKISEWSGQFEKAAFGGESSELDFCDPETLQYHNVRCFQITPGYCACIVSDVTAQRQLEQQQSLQTLEYKFVDESLPSGFVIASPYPDFHIEFINKTMLRMLRYDSYDDFIAHVGYSAWSFIHPDDLDRTRQAALHCGDSIDTFEIDYRILRKDGSLLWVNQCSKHAVNAAGKPLVFAYYTDITESKQKDEELRRDAQRYQALVESIPGGVGVYKFSEKPVVTYFNDRVATLCGLTREEYQQIASDDAMAVIYPEDRAGLAHEIEQAIAEKRNIAYTYRLIVKDKGYVWIHLSGCPMEDSEDGYPVYSTVFLDINADKQRELELKTQQQKLQVALKNTDTYIWEFDFKQHCILQEANSQSVHGYSAVIQNVPQSLIESGFVHSDYIPAYRDIFRQLFEGAETASGDFLVRTADQSGWWRERITYT
ncbi:MAG: PAS domain-containing protein, partial [Pygmaiobacter sp.]